VSRDFKDLGEEKFFSPFGAFEQGVRRLDEVRNE
jgi:hypothetical protein